MQKLQLSCWVLLIACSGKLSVDSNGPSGGAAGAAGGCGVSYNACHPGSAGSGIAGQGAGGYGIAGHGTDGTGAAAGSGVGGVPSGTPGYPGATCIPAELRLEGEGTPEQTQVRYLDRCYYGLACVAGLCVPAPDCSAATTGECVIHRGTGAGGSGGGDETQNRDGMGIGLPGASGWGGSGQQLPTDPVTTSGVTDMTLHETKLYWVDYGTRDSLGNHQHDGAVLSYELANGQVSTVVPQLAGPIGIGVSDSYVYVMIDGAPLIRANIHPQIWRVPLAGGNAELVQDQGTTVSFTTLAQSFAAAGDQAFWTGQDGIYAITGTPGASASLFASGPAVGENSDGTSLFYADSSDSIWSIPVGGGTPTRIISPAYGTALQGGLLYGVESAGMLDSTSGSSGDAWTRVRALGSYVGGVRVSGGRFFMASSTPGFYWSTAGVLTVTLGSEPPTRLLDPVPALRVWAGAASALFWNVGGDVHMRSLAGL